MNASVYQNFTHPISAARVFLIKKQKLILDQVFLKDTKVSLLTCDNKLDIFFVFFISISLYISKKNIN